MRDRAQLYALFALIVYAPLPLASDRPWALVLLGLLCGAMVLWSLWQPAGRSAGAIWDVARIPLLVQLGWIALLAVQLVALPVAWSNTFGRDVLSVYTGQSISIDVYSTRLYLAKACVLFAVFWLVLAQVNSRRRMELLVKVVVFSGLFQAILGIVLMATGTTFDLFFVPMVDGHAHGTFVYHNHLAGYLEMSLAAGVGLMIAKLDGRPSVNWRQRLHNWLSLLFSEKILLRVCLVIMVIGLIATRSRMGNSAFFASLLIVGIFTVMLTKYTTRNIHEVRAKEVSRAMILFIVSLIVIDVAIIGGVVGIEKVVQRIENTNLEAHARVEPAEADAKPLRAEESVEQRSRAARYATRIVSDYPFAGLGGGTFHLSFPHYVKPDVFGFYDHAHNDYVEFASEAGLSGVMLLLLLVMNSMARSVGLLARSEDQMVRGMAFASLMGIVSLLIHAAVDFNFQNPANAMLFMIMLCFPYLMSRRAGKHADL